MEMEQFLQKVTSEIKSKGFTQVQMAELLGLKKETFENMLQNRTRFPVDVLMRLSAFIKVPMCYWFEDKIEVSRVAEPDQNYEYRNKYYERLEHQVEFYEQLLKNKFNYDCKKDNDVTIASFVSDRNRGTGKEGQSD
jgi:transcriptional regulator with XRE-family HTH domain